MNENSFVIGLAGDTMIGRNVSEVISYNNYLYPWGNTLSLLAGADVNILNLETALTNSNDKVSKLFNFKAAPDRIRTLTGGHITFANIANNHIMDFSEEGLLETIHTLKEAHIHYAGAGKDEQEAAEPAIITWRDISIGILGFTDNEPGWRAGSSHCGTNYIDISDHRDREKAVTAIRELRNKAGIIIISIHWGPNMREEPAPAFVEFAHEMIDNGADIIHGHSAHIFQGIEVYKNKLILYDTGDFVDDYVVDTVLRNDHSFLFQAKFVNGNLRRLQLIPVLISKCQVNLAPEKEKWWSLRRIQRLSAAFGTKITDAGEIIFQVTVK